LYRTFLKIARGGTCEKGEKIAVWMGYILRRSRGIMQMRNYFSTKCDNFKLDRGWYNNRYYGAL
jgi:hypothetical protein